MQVDEGDEGSWGWDCPLSSVCPGGPVICPAGVSYFSFLLSFMHSLIQRKHVGNLLQHCRIRIQRWHLAGLLGHPCHPRVPSLTTARGCSLA